MQITEDLVMQLTQRYGTPLYLFRSDDFRINYTALLDTIRSVYPEYHIAYSYKTNYTPRICQIVKEMGGYAEVVSDMEYALAKHLGYGAQQIIYNGPYKGELLDDHFLNGGIVNIDNPQEAKRLCGLALKHPDRVFKAGMRVNIDIGQNFISRFGMEPGSKDFNEAFYAITITPNMMLAGIHCHIGHSRDINSWRRRAEEITKVIDAYFDNIPEYINLGSGMFAQMEDALARQFGDAIPSYRDYANIMAEPFRRKYADLPEQQKPKLFTEPGTTVSNSYIDFLGRVESFKVIRGKKFAALNCSKDNIGDICQLKQLPIVVFYHNEQKHEHVELVGYTCLEQDVLYRDYSGPIAIGDDVLIKNVGGYSTVSKPPFILPNCPMIEVRENGETEVIKRQETFEDVFATYQF